MYPWHKYRGLKSSLLGFEGVKTYTLYQWKPKGLSLEKNKEKVNTPQAHID